MLFDKQKIMFEVNYEFLSQFFLIIQGICYWCSYKYIILWKKDTVVLYKHIFSLDQIFVVFEPNKIRLAFISSYRNLFVFVDTWVKFGFNFVD